MQMRLGAPGDSVDDMLRQIIDTFNEVYAKISRAVSPAGKEDVAHEGAGVVLRLGGRVRAAVRRPVSFEPTARLPREQVLANLQMAPTDNKLDYLHRGLNELLFFELFTAGEAVDRQARGPIEADAASALQSACLARGRPEGTGLRLRAADRRPRDLEPPRDHRVEYPAGCKAEAKVAHS